MLWSPPLSLSFFHIKLTAKGLLRNLSLPPPPPPCRRSTLVPHAVDKNKPREASTINNRQNKTTKTNNLHPPTQVSESSNLLVTSHSKPGVVGFQSRTGSRPSPKPSPKPSHKPSPKPSPKPSHKPSPKPSPKPSHKPSSHPGSRSIEGGLKDLDQNGRGQARLCQLREQEKKKQTVVQLKRLLLQNNRTTEALSVVLQYHLTQNEEASKQKKELLDQLDLRQELVSSSQCLLQEKDEALSRFQQQQKEEQVSLEERLRCFYQSQWDKVQQVYQEEADRYRQQVENQVEELRREHRETVETLRQQYDEMKGIHQTELKNLQKKLKETEAASSAAAAEKEVLSEKLRVEQQRNSSRDRNLMDTHTVYLQQELESVKVVLEMKSSQLQQKDKRLMELEQLVESNVKLEENLKRVQQENELNRVRMDQQTLLSKQLCSQQAVLQQTLVQESKVNKRLSMENEELMWKLSNADIISSPRRLSPSSPFGSPRNSASFPAAAPL